MSGVIKQEQQKDWFDQWKIFDRNEVLFLFEGWIFPQKLEDLQGKDVLEAGCGGGPHTELVAQFARHITAVDLNTAALARQRLEGTVNVDCVEDDIATMDLKRSFDIVFSVGVVHHTDDPDKTVQNLKRHVKPGGKLILWVYAKEGNWLVEHVVEPLRKLFLKNLSRKTVLNISAVSTALVYIPAFTVYFLPLRFLPYFQYFTNWRKLPFNRNLLNVFDKLNAPQVAFISKQRVESWFKDNNFKITHLSHYVGVSWRITAQRQDG